MNSEYYMRMALDLAKKGMGYTSPNPINKILNYIKL